MTLKEKIARVVQHNVATDEYIESLPPDIRDAFFDNAYSNEQGMLIDFLMKEVFGDLYEDVCWFLYDWKPGFEIVTNTENGGSITYTINSIDDYCDFVKTHYGVE